MQHPSFRFYCRKQGDENVKAAGEVKKSSQNVRELIHAFCKKKKIEQWWCCFLPDLSLLCFLLNCPFLVYEVLGCILCSFKSFYSVEVLSRVDPIFFLYHFYSVECGEIVGLPIDKVAWIEFSVWPQTQTQSKKDGFKFYEQVTSKNWQIPMVAKATKAMDCIDDFKSLVDPHLRDFFTQLAWLI